MGVRIYIYINTHYIYVHYTLYTTHCTVYIIHYTLYTIHYTVCTLYIYITYYCIIVFDCNVLVFYCHCIHNRFVTWKLKVTSVFKSEELEWWLNAIVLQWWHMALTAVATVHIGTAEILHFSVLFVTVAVGKQDANKNMHVLCTYSISTHIRNCQLRLIIDSTNKPCLSVACDVWSPQHQPHCPAQHLL